MHHQIGQIAIPPTEHQSGGVSFYILEETDFDGTKVYRTAGSMTDEGKAYGEVHLDDLGCTECVQTYFNTKRDARKKVLHLGPAPRRFQHLKPECNCNGEKALMFDAYDAVKHKRESGPVYPICKVYAERKQLLLQLSRSYADSPRVWSSSYPHTGFSGKFDYSIRKSQRGKPT